MVVVQVMCVQPVYVLKQFNAKNVVSASNHPSEKGPVFYSFRHLREKGRMTTKLFAC